jgi:uncharacterized protein (DUF433 family)
MEATRTFDRITFDPGIMRGRACIRGMRIPVSVIVGQIAHGATYDEILSDYPDLEREDIQQAIGYAGWHRNKSRACRSGPCVSSPTWVCQ